MGWKIKLIAVVLGLLFALVVLRNVKRSLMRPPYAVLWIGMSLFLLSIAVLEPLYKWFATSLIGINDARHIIYIALIGFLLTYMFYLTAMVSRMSNQIRRLITTVAILEDELSRRRKAPPASEPPAPSLGL